MTISTAEWRHLEDTAHRLRKLTLDTVVWGGSGHIGGAMSAMDILTVLYHRVMNYDPKRLDWEDRDRFVLSKGHVGIGYAPLLADLGCFPAEWLKTYNKTGSKLAMHLDANKVPGVEASTGSLGHGLAMALGMALGARIKDASFRVFCMLGDGECNEGSVWEAAMAASHYRVDNLVAFVDRNHAMIDGPTETVMGLEPFADKWRAFGWETFEVDGHDIPALCQTITAALAVTGKPAMILCDTVKGEGIDFIAGDYKWHYGAFDDDLASKAHQALDAYHASRIMKVREN